MKNSEIKRKVNKAFSNAAPDNFDAVIRDCDTGKGTVIDMKKNRKSLIIKLVASAAAVVLLAAAALTGIYSYLRTPVSTVSLDVNPGIELSLNKSDRVLSVTALNSDGAAILGDMDLTGTDLETAVNALIGSMLKNGYLSDISNSILISVDGDNAQKNAQIQKQLSAVINSLLQNNEVEGAVLTQSVTTDANIQALAEKYGISEGKAQFVYEIVNANPRYTVDELAALSVNELNLISQSSQTSLNNVTSAGTASEKAYVGVEAAKKTALSYAGVSEASVRELDVELEYENGVMVYDVEFKAGAVEYDFNINASTGEIIDYKREHDDDYSGNGNGGSQNNTSSQNGTSSSQNGSGNAYGQNGGSSGSQTQNGDGSCYYSDDIIPEGNYIAAKTAKQTAIDHAGVPGADIREYKCVLENDDGVILYEIEFKYNNYEYEYEINATDGTIIDSSREWDN